jgi:hypothetical protein
MNTRDLKEAIRALGYDLGQLELRIGEEKVPVFKRVQHQRMLRELYRREKKA